MGTWNESGGRAFVINSNGRFMFAGNQPGTWKLTTDGLILTWTQGRVDTYTTRNGDAISGDSTLGHKVTITKTQR